MNYDKKRWVILFTSCLINLCIGSVYAWSVFASPMAEYMGVETGELSIIFTIANAVGPITMISGGKINDKIGPKWVVFTGGLVYGAGFVASSICQSVTMLAISFGICVGLGLGMIYGCTINNSIKFFPDKRGLIGGVVTASYGFGSVIIPLIANSLIADYGILVTFRCLGIAFLVIICGGSLIIDKCPEGYHPVHMKAAMVQTLDNRNDKTWKEMIKDPMFYLMFAMLICGAFYGLMIISQTSALAQNMIKVTPATAAICVSVLALFNVGGRIGAGLLSDKLGRVNTLVTVLFLSVIGLIVLITSGEGEIVHFMAGISVIGFSFGSYMGIFPGFTAEQFGSKNSSENYGIMFIAFAFAGIFGPVILKNIYQVYGTYTYAFVIGICFALIGLTIAMLITAYKAKQNLMQESQIYK